MSLGSSKITIEKNEIRGVLGDWTSNVILMDFAGSDLDIVNTARISYQKDSHKDTFLNDKDKGLLESMIKKGHLSPFEHTMLKFSVTCPLFVARQWMRHRIGWSYNEVSRRYTSDNIEFYVPYYRDWRLKGETDEKVRKKLTKDTAELFDLFNEYYESLIGIGVSPEQARMVLPQGMYTRFYATTNLRALMHFYKLRTGSGAQVEIVKYAEVLSELAFEVFPESWGIFVKSL